MTPLPRFFSSPLPSLISLVLLLACTFGLPAQTLTGSSVADPAIPTVISPSVNSSDYFILNKDLSLSGRFRAQTSQTIICPAPAGFSASSATPRSLLNDGESAYFTAQSSTANVAASTSTPGYPCTSAAALSLAGGTATQTFSTNDQRHGRYHVLEAFGGNGPDTLTVISNLNTNSSSTPTLTKASSISLDTGGTYTSMVTDLWSDYGLTAVTQLRTPTSAGGLWVYSPGIQTAFKILGPGGTALPAIGAFIIPSTANDNGDLLVLVNQDGLTSSNLSSPPLVANPFTIIDLGQLQRAFSAVVSQGTTITLPSVTRIPATTPYYAMLGATYSPVFHLLYAVVAGGTSSASVTENVIRYDPTTPNAPAETVVADVSNIPFTLGNYPQLALNAAAGTMEILSGGILYHVPVAGKGNTASVVTGSAFPDSNFSPTYIASNPLLGETYIASASQVDILTLPATSVPRATIELYGTDNAIANQSYTLYANGINPNSDSTLTFATVTFTATPAGGSPVVLGTAPFYNFTGAPGSSTSVKFPAAGIYSVVATVPSSGAFPAFSSLPITVGVGATGVAAPYQTNTRLIVPSTSTSTTVTASLTMFGATYAPTGRIIISDATGNQAGRYDFTGGATSYPVSVTLTLPTGTSNLTAVYNGDTQNQSSTSPTVAIVVGNQVKSSLGLTVPASAAVGATVNGTVFYSAAAGATGTPTGNILIQTTTATNPTPVTIATVPVATAYSNPITGVPFTFTAPASGTYSIFATYPGDANFSAFTSASTTLVTSAPLVAVNLGISSASTVTAGVPFPATITYIPKTTSTIAPTGNITYSAALAGSSPQTISTTVSAASAFASGGVAVQTNLTALGSYTLTVSYAGDATYAAATGTIGITVGPPAKTTPTINISIPNTATVGDKLVGSVSYTFAGTVVPTGNMIFNLKSSSGTIVPTTSIPASNARNSLVTIFNFTAPASDVYSGYVTYDGDPSFNAATSNIITLTVYGAAPTTSVLTVSGPSVVQGTTNFNVTVKLIPKSVLAAAPTGNIVLQYTNVNVSVPPRSFGTVSASAAAQPGGAIVTGQVALSDIGTFSISASYDGDTNYTAPTPVAYGFNEFEPTKLTIGTVPLAYANTSISIPVALNSGYNPATGNVFISSSLNGVAGPSANVPASSLTGGGGLATFNFPSAGTWTLSGTYLGDAATGSSTATGSVVVSPPLTGAQFTFTVDNPSVGIPGNPLFASSGQTSEAGLTLTAVGGFSTPVSLAFTTAGSTRATVTLVDASGAPVLTTTPVAAGTQIKVRLHDPVFNAFALNSPHSLLVKAPEVLACGLFGVMLFGWRRNKLRLPRGRGLGLLGTVLLILATGSVLSGCTASSTLFSIVITATPVNNTQGAAPQVLTYYLSNDQ